jgi:CSLREA domain-containing protein
VNLVPAFSAMRRWSLLALAAGLLLFAGALAAAAPAARADDTIVVDTTADPGPGECDEGGECSLREAIELVDEGEVSGDVLIEITAEGRIEIGEEGELFIDPEEEAVDSVKIVGTGPEETIVDGQGEVRAFWITGGDITLANLGVTDGNVTGFTLDGDGGAALFQAAGDVRLEDVHFNDNEIDSAREGGAIAVEEGNLTVVDSVVNGNETNSELNDPNLTDGRGGGIFSESSGSLTLERTEVSNNVAVAGGGVYQSGGTLNIVGGRFETDLAGAGGAIATGGGSSASIEAALVAGNDAVYDGGGIKVQGSDGFLIVNSILTGNSSQVLGGDGIEVEGPTTIEATTISGSGGVTGGGNGEVEETEASAIGVEGPLELRNSTVAENVGIGIDATSGTTTIHGSTIAENEASAGEAGGISGEGAVSMVSSILALNTVAGTPADCDTTIESRGNNLLQTTAGCDWESAAGDIFNADPQLRPLGEYEGPTNTMGPESRESPVINNGSEPLATDQRGFTRPVPAGAVNTDIGAFEVQAPENEEPPFIGPFDEELEPVVGETLTCSAGTWDTDTVTDTTSSYAWFSNGAEVATGATYVVANSDAGQEIECEETVDNGATSAAARSEAVELQPALAHLDPTSLDLGSLKVGTGPGPAQTLTLTNEGSADLEVSDVSSDDAQFPVDGSACTAAPIAPEASCVIEASFAPTVPGAQFATLTVESNGGEQLAELTGTGIVPVLSVAPGFHDFGQQLVGGTSVPQTFVVTNIGTASMTLGEVELGGDDPGEFDLGPADTCSDATLEPGEECTVEVAFSPASPTGFSAMLLFPGEAPTGSVGLEGLGVLPAFSASPASVDFGSQQVGGSDGATETISVTNSGSAPLEIDTVTLAGTNPGEFAIESDDCAGETLTPDGECTVEVAFAPTATGERAAGLVLSGNAPSYFVALKGTGTQPMFSVAPTSFDFGSQLVGGTTAPHTFTVTNSGTAPLAISQASIGGESPTAFTLIRGDDCFGATLDPNETCTVEVAFTPSSPGALNATLVLAGSAPSYTVPLQGTGTIAVFAASPTSLDFGTTQIGEPAPAQTVTLTSAGTGPVTVDQVSIAGEAPGSFAIVAGSDECSGETLAPTETCTVEVAFRPTAAGSLEATLVIAGSAPSHFASLHGDGSTPPAPPDPAPNPSPSPAPVPQPPASPPNTRLRPHSSPYKADAKGKVKLMVTCESASGAACNATLTLLSTGKTKDLPKKLGSAKTTLVPGVSRRVAIKLNKKTLAVLTERERLPAVASIATANGTSSRTRIVLTALPR